MRLLVTDTAAQSPRQATAWLIMTLGRNMPNPTQYTAQQIRDEAEADIRFLVETIERHPKWTWPKQLLPLAREFVALTQSPKSNYAEAEDFSHRLTNHIRRERLKGMDDMIWRAKALAEQKKNEKGA